MHFILLHFTMEQRLVNQFQTTFLINLKLLPRLPIAYNHETSNLAIYSHETSEDKLLEA